MAHLAPAHWLAEALAPFDATFGAGLRCTRFASGARWSYEGHSAIVELSAPDRITARFVAPPSLDAISGRPSAPVYMREGSGYALTRSGCEQMVADMTAFFSGTREPQFRFIAAG